MMVNVIDRGVRPDGSTLNTAAIQAAIDSLSGGGTLVFPPGVYLTGSLVLVDNLALRLEQGAVLKGSPNPLDYERIVSPWSNNTDRQVDKSLLYAYGREKLTLEGQGTIDGNGGAKAFLTGTNNDPARPFGIRFIRCQNVNVSGLRLRNSAQWMQHYLACEDVVIRDLMVDNHCNQNNDGLDIDGCRNVDVSNCVIDSDDDALCLKSNGPAFCENVSIRNCTLSSHCNAFKLGTETTAGFRNIEATGITVRPSRRSDRAIYGHPRGLSAIALMIVDGGLMEDVRLSDFSVEGTQTLLFIRLGDRARPYADGVAVPAAGEIRNVLIRRVRGAGLGGICSHITALPAKPVRDIVLEDISMDCEAVETCPNPADIPELDRSYPEANMYGVMPVRGLFLRHCENVRLTRVVLPPADAAQPCSLMLDDVRDASIGVNDGDVVVLARRSRGTVAQSGPRKRRTRLDAGDAWREIRL
jgi:hypothetical protein